MRGQRWLECFAEHCMLLILSEEPASLLAYIVDIIFIQVPGNAGPFIDIMTYENFFRLCQCVEPGKKNMTWLDGRRGRLLVLEEALGNLPMNHPFIADAFLAKCFHIILIYLGQRPPDFQKLLLA